MLNIFFIHLSEGAIPGLQPDAKCVSHGYPKRLYCKALRCDFSLAAFCAVLYLVARLRPSGAQHTAQLSAHSYC